MPQETRIMGQRTRRQNNRQKPRAVSSPSTASREPVVAIEKKPTVIYGKPFVLLEDDQRNTFIYKGGQWTRHTRSIAECQEDCHVKELGQKINGMTRYEIYAPLSDAD
jgi:hypothetical protein